MSTEYGVVNLKKLLDYLFTSAATFLTLDKDGDNKVEFGEILTAMSGPLLFKFPAIYEGIPMFKKEVADLSDEELKELVDYVNAQDYFPADFDNLEEFIRKTVNWLHYNYRFVKFAKGFFS